MTPIDRLVAVNEISDLIGRYCMMFDDEDWVGLDGLWDDNAAFVVEGVAFEGRHAVIEFLSSCLPDGYRSKHMISRPIVDVSSDGESAQAYTDVVWVAANFENTIVGRYEDDLVRRGGRWRFLRRVEVPVKYVPGAPPMSDDASGVSGATMRTPQ